MEKSGIIPTVSNSLEDFSEYMDAEENISAPTELLAEFLYSVMIKDYEKALQYCTQILSYEPDNATVKEFRPLIEEKLEILRNKELQDSSSDSSLSCSSSTSGSSDNLRSIKNDTCLESANSYSSSLESDDGSNESTGTCRSNFSQSDIRNGNAKTASSSPATEDSMRHNNGSSSNNNNNKNNKKNNNNKEISASVTRTIIHSKLPAHQTQTRILRRDGVEEVENDEISDLKNENQSKLLHSTVTKVLKKENSLSPVKDNNSRTLAWFSSLQENIFGTKKQKNPTSKNLVQKPGNSSNNAQAKKTQ